ncbi:pentapeptide repeat-containing protein [archaeon]|nr:pentapeptide repeat-containing protein [archaeon]
MLKRVMSSEFLESLRSGQKGFDEIEIHYGDLSGSNFDGVTIRNSKFVFTSFRNCTFNNVLFENCEMMFVAMGFSNFRNSMIKNCKLEYSGFTKTIFNDTKIVDSSLSWLSLMDADISGLSIIKCSEFNVLRNISELSPTMIDSVMKDLAPFIQQMDFDTQQKINRLFEVIDHEHKVQLSDVPASSKSGYSEKSSGSYGVFDTIIDRAITTYGGKNSYTMKKGYETGEKSGYKA